MNYYFITGTSSGIGKALAEILLDDESNYVYGYSRRKTIHHKRFIHIPTDLSSFKHVNSIRFPVPKKPSKVVLINNAGQIGDIKPIGQADNMAIANLFMVNVTAVNILMNNFIKRFASEPTEKIILNVSSGAGKNPIEGWAPYCGSKAAVDLMSLTVFEEQKREKHPIKVYSVAPGVVDTEMQVAIRDSNESDFSKHQYFVDLKANNGLTPPTEAAEKYIRILNHTVDFPDCIFSLRDL